MAGSYQQGAKAVRYDVKIGTAFSGGVLALEIRVDLALSNRQRK